MKSMNNLCVTLVTTFNLEMSLSFDQFRGMAPPPQDNDYNERKLESSFLRAVPSVQCPPT